MGQNNKIIIKGIQKTSLIDYPGKICTTIFLGNCNFRCGFCHNKELVLNPENLNTVSEEEFFSHLKSKENLVEAVCISGGEPAIHENLPEFIQKIKTLGFLVKLDTNGSAPEMLSFLLQKNLLNYVAMDIKSDIKNYEKAAGVKVDIEKIKKSAEIIMKFSVDYEFRTTAVQGLLDEKIAENIGIWLKGAKRYVLQNFVSERGTLDPNFQKISPFSDEEMKKFKKILEKYFGEVLVK